MAWRARPRRAVALAVPLAFAVLAGSAAASPDDPAPKAPRSREARFALALSEAADPVIRCGGAGPVREAVTRRLHRPVFLEPEAPERGPDFTLTLSVVAVPGQRRWRAHIVETDQEGRELGDRTVGVEAPSCTAGQEALGVLLAIMIGPPRAVLVREAAPAPAPVPSTPVPLATAAPAAPAAPTAPTRAPRPPAPAAAVPPSSRWRVEPSVEVVAGTGVLPHLAWGAQVGVALHPADDARGRAPPWLLARVAYWPKRSTGTSPEGRIDRLALTALGCVPLRQRSPGLALCAGVEAGRLTATAPELSGDQSFARGLLALPVEGRLGLGPYRWRSVGFEPSVGAQISAVLLRDRFTYDGATRREITLHQPAPVAFQTALGLAAHFF